MFPDQLHNQLGWTKREHDTPASAWFVDNFTANFWRGRFLNCNLLHIACAEDSYHRLRRRQLSSHQGLTSQLHNQQGYRTIRANLLTNQILGAPIASCWTNTISPTPSTIIFAHIWSFLVNITIKLLLSLSWIISYIIKWIKRFEQIHYPLTPQVRKAHDHEIQSAGPLGYTVFFFFLIKL